LIEAFISALTLILITELGDKSMLMSMIFSARYKKRLLVLTSVILALATVTIIGIVIGFIIFEIIPEIYLNYISGSIFIILGIYYIINSRRETEDLSIDTKVSFASIYSLTFISEFGDKTQIAIISLIISTMEPIGVFIGAIIGFLVINLMAVYVGEKISKKISINLIKTVSAIIFIIFGILTILNIL
jgi:putative Ca2+/H+ antiporter (TMEM165/GDT1 family)